MTRPQAPQAFRGEALGLPQSGPGSLSPTGPRLGAFVLDAIASTLIAALFVHNSGKHGFAERLPGSWSLIPLAIDYIAGALFAGRTLGMYLFGVRLVRVDDQDAAVDPVRILLRTLLLFLLVPAVVFDRDGRGMHDRFSNTAVVRS